MAYDKYHDTTFLNGTHKEYRKVAQNEGNVKEIATFRRTIETRPW